MHPFLPLIVVLACFPFLSGCVSTADFKVVEALAIGMSQEEAKATIASYGFTMAEAFDRPEGGWPSERENFQATRWRAGREEAHLGKQVSRVEFYPVGHGLLGYGQLFLFYGEDGRLLDFHRYQIN
ncbi:hypothetical protein ASA1KI_03510 [Opitutales bacterium ASA1]|uniref:hypothetical protein n=1 Tax=Congregicoccus parvus TaxID=3081749 RepID=UPI002B2DB039|nr:hypothetical protein ASA1KI_03510 [Opitutales bacterium ASA1]